MSESNGSWGELASFDSELAETWDQFEPLPEPGENPALDAFCERKRITIGSLVRIGARLSDTNVMAVVFDGGIKYRDIVTDRRWSHFGAQWGSLKIVPTGPEGSERVIVAEGETDAARLTEIYDVDVAIMPGGADYFPSGFADQLAGYRLVLVGLDQDAAGNRGAKRIMKALPHAVRFAPTGSDWCDSDEIPPLLDQPSPEQQVLVPAGALLEIEEPHIASWFDHALLPVAGLLVLHGWVKSYKSFLTLDMMSALAQGQDWCCFEPTEEPCRVAVIQYELPWAFYRKRVVDIRHNARLPDQFDSNFYSWQPLKRPDLIAGKKQQEDFVINALENEGIQVVLIDPIRRAARGTDMNEEKDVSRMLAFFERLNDVGITVVATHHDSKDSARSRGGDPLGMTGSGAWAGDPDTIVSVELPRNEDWNSPRRNLHFTFRNSPPISPRGMEIQEGSQIQYTTEAHGFEEDPDAPSI